MSLPSNTAGLGTPSISSFASFSASHHGAHLGTSGRNPCTPQNLEVVSSFTGDGMFLAYNRPTIATAGNTNPATVQGLDSYTMHHLSFSEVLLRASLAKSLFSIVANGSKTR
jgi:hypothetical protein